MPGKNYFIWWILYYKKIVLLLVILYQTKLKRYTIFHFCLNDDELFFYAAFKNIWSIFKTLLLVLQEFKI